jgi:hypothetical protein
VEADVNGIGLTWDEVAKRPGTRDGRTYCFDCWLHFDARGVPCLRHTRPSERQARAKAIGAIR